MEQPSSNLILERAPGLASRYVVERELGRGTMGVVYEAHDTRLGRTVALKTIELAFTVGPRERADFEERFFNEARVAAQLSHPGIVVCHDVGKDPATDQLFIVFECLKGRTLADRMAARQPMTWCEALPIVAGLARAIHHAHEHGIVHRDLKPANVFLLESGSTPAVKILDFGVARVESMRARLTASGQSFGSPLYMSPEQALGQPTDARSDIFSLGSILCTVLLGRPWFDAPNIPAIFARLLSDEPPRISSLVPDAPAGVDAIVGRAMAKPPDERYHTARDLAEDLESVMAGLGPGHANAAGPAVGHGELPPTLDLDSFLADLGGGGHLIRSAGGGDRTGTVDVLARLLDEAPPAVEMKTPPPAVAWRNRKIWFGGAAAFVVLTSLVTAGALRGRGHEPATAAVPAVPPAPPTHVPELVVLAPKPKSWIMVDAKHSLRTGRLKLWVDGEVAVDTVLHAPVKKRIVAFTIREGRMATPLEVEPGRHELKALIAWDDERRSATTRFEAVADATRILEVRLAGRSKELTLDWK